MAADLDKWQREDAIRKAEVAFITDDQKRPLEFWWSQLVKDYLSLADFMPRASAGHWQLRRDKYWASVTQGVLKDSRRRAIMDRSRELQELQQVRQNTLELVQPRMIDGQKVYLVPPNSYESLVGALVKVDQVVDGRRQVILNMIEPDIKREMKQASTVFSPDEIRNVARLLLESRRAKQQEALSEPEGEHLDDSQEEQ
jgi:hypothetical protein